MNRGNIVMVTNNNAKLNNMNKNSSSDSFELKKNMTYEMTTANVTSREYMMTDDIKMDKL